jgi:hypothetical protein
VEIAKITQETANRKKIMAALPAQIQKTTAFITATQKNMKTADATQLVKLAAQLKHAQGELLELNSQLKANNNFTNQIAVQLATSQKLLVAEQHKYDADMDAQIKLRKAFIANLAVMRHQALQLAANPHLSPAAKVAAAKKLEAQAAAAFKPIREPGHRFGLEETDMAAELFPLLKQCIDDNKAFLQIMRKLTG